MALDDTIFLQLPLPAFVVDAELRVVDVNPEFTRRFGRAAAELRGRNVAVLPVRDDLAALIEVLGRLRRGEAESVSHRCRLGAADGTARTAELTLQPIRLGDARATLAIVCASARAEDAGLGTMREELLRALFEDGPVPLLVQDDTFVAVEVNQACCDWIGHARDEILGRDPIDLMDDASRAAELARRTGQPLHAVAHGSFERVMRHREGHPMQARVYSRPLVDAAGQCFGMVMMIDVTEERARQRRLEALSHTQERFFDLAPVGCLVRDEHGVVVRVNRAYVEMTGYAAAELVGRAVVLAPDEPAAAAALEAMRRHLRTSPASIARSRGPLITKDGRELTVERLATWIQDEDGHWYRLTVVADVTQRSALEDDLKQLVLQQGALLRTMAAGVMMVVNDRVVRCNPSLEGLLGLPSDRIVGRGITEVLQADRSWASIRDDSAAAIARDASFGCEVEVDRPGLPPITCALQLRSVDPMNPDAGQIVTLHDITELNRQQSSLRKANAELSALVENTAVAIAYLDGQRVVRANRLMENLLGLAPGRLPGETLPQFLPPDDRSAAELLQALSDPVRRSCTVGTKLRRANGELVACLVHVGPVDSVRWPSASILVAIDMSGHEAALTALADSQERFGRFADAIEEAVFVIDVREHSALYASSRFEQVLCVPAETFYREPAAAWRHVDPQDRPKLDALIAHALEPGPHEADIRIDRPDGRQRVVRVRFFPARVGSHELYGLAEDVTESRHDAQRRVDEAIEQRDTLVREVHHRIKNNLQGVAGLLQQAASRRPEIAPQLEEVVGQIQAIAQVHGLQVRGKGDLSLSKLVRAVLDNLSRGFGQPIDCAAEGFDALESWSIPEQEAVPMALVVNELGTNAIKHRGGDGRVSAELAVAGEGLALRIRNPGTLPDGFMIERLDPAPSGLSLVRALLPRRGTRLSLALEGGLVVAELQIGAPVLRRSGSGNIH